MKSILIDKYNSINQSELNGTDLDALKKLFKLTEDLKTNDDYKIDVAIKILDKIIEKNLQALNKSHPNSIKMKRYIEIVYDNSGSMITYVGNRMKYEIAQELFEKEILPSIGLRGDQVVLRLLKDGCESSKSYGEPMPNQRNSMLTRIKNIKHNLGSTPLFYSVLDSVEACRKVNADEHLIFVLTDGDDTCRVKIEDLIDEETLKKYVRFYKVLLVQLAVNSPISRNNLTAFTNALGGQAISLDSSESMTQMRKKMKVALNTSGFTNKFPLEHCFDNLPGFDIEWEGIEAAGIDFHQAMLLFQKGMLTWIPDFNTSVNTRQYAELRFLFALYFKSGIPEDLLKTMLSQLKKPYYYSFDCIYWDFASARWRYVVKQNKIEQLPNKEARFEDSIDNKIDEDQEKEMFESRKLYRVNQIPMNDISGTKFQLEKLESNTEKDIRILRDGDLLKFH